MLSRSHPIARRVRALRDDAALREKEGVIVAEGVHLALDALDARAAIECAIVSPRLAESEEGRRLAGRLAASGVHTLEASDATVESLQDARAPQPVVLLVRWSPAPLDGVLEARKPDSLVVVACRIQDPGNVGALWRTADAAFAGGFVVTTGSAALGHPRTVRASMGSVFRLPAAAAELTETIEGLSRRGFRMIGADARRAVPYTETDWRGLVALFLGSEGSGLPEEAASRIDARVGIPMAPGVESLSVNAAAAVLLFAAARARNAISSGG